jgi:hypothetical protein
MPEANVLYTVTAVVVAGLVLWVLASLKMAKQPWPRPEAVTAIAAAKSVKGDADVRVEKTEDKPANSAEPADSAAATATATATATASTSDDTAESTRVKIDDNEEPKAEEKAEETALEEEKKEEEKKSEA